MSFDQKARSAISSIIKPWTSKYLSNITLIDSTTPQQIYMVQFSLPTSSKPIPIATVQVYFYIQPTTPLTIKFKFQKDSLVHTVNQTIRASQMENLIESLLHKKLLIRENVFYLGTDYEVTRVKDQRQDRILQQKEIQIEQEYVYISPDLISDQKRSIQMSSLTLNKDHTKLVHSSFLQVDKDGLGVVTTTQLIQILSNLSLKLDQTDIHQIISKVDKDKQGLITFDEYRSVADEIVKTMIAKDEAVVRLKNNEEEYELSSVMMVISNNIHGIYERVAEKFKKIDEDELGYLRLPDVKAVLEEINVEILRDEEMRILKKEKRSVKPPSKLKEGQKMRNDKAPSTSQQSPEPLLTLMQLQQFTKKLSERYPFAQVRYHNLVPQLLLFKLHNLRKGLLDSNQTLLQSHLRQLFTARDNDRLNKIHVSELVKALEEDQKIRLTKGQLYVVKSIVERDGKDMVGYVGAAKLLAEVVKRMWLTSQRRRVEEGEKMGVEKEMRGQGEVVEEEGK